MSRISTLVSEQFKSMRFAVLTTPYADSSLFLLYR